MANLDPDSAWEFADAIKQLFPQAQTCRRATVQRVDNDGTIWVQLPGASHTTPIQSTGANVQPGDEVLTELRGNSLHITENQTDPAIGATTATRITRAIVQPVNAEAQAAKGIAAEAQAVAQATGQHFFADDNGAHITDVTQDEWAAAVDDDFSDYDPDTKPYHNQLLNSLGILLRTALNNLVSITRSAIAFYDGVGNAASNIVARFGSDGAQIGKSTGQHVAIDQDSLDIMNGEATLATFGETAVIGQRNNAGSMNIYLGKSESYNPGITQIIRWADRTSYHPYFTAIHDRNNGNDYVLIGSGGGTYPGYGQYSVALGSFSWQTAGSFGRYSIAEGKDSCAGGEASHAQNLGTIAAKRSQTAIGTYNEEDTSSTTTHPSGDARYGDYALIIGNGTADNARGNALAVDWDGYLYPCNEKMPDFVTEQGTSGIWTYRKWHSGIMECWGIYTASMAVNTSSAQYGGYRSGIITAPDYPYAFTAVPVVSAMMVNNAQGAWVNNAQNSTATAFKFYLSTGQSLAAANRGISIHAIGRWK